MKWDTNILFGLGFGAGFYLGWAYARTSSRRGSLPLASSKGLVKRTGKCLQLVQEIPLTDTGNSFKGRFDHLSYDSERKLIFIACLGEHAVVVVDAFAGSALSLQDVSSPEQTLLGRFGLLSYPQGILFVAATNRLYVANAGNGKVHVFQICEGKPCQTWKTWRQALNLLTIIDFGEEADNLRYADGQVFVGYGEGAIGVINDGSEVSRENIDFVCPGGHPEGFQLEMSSLAVNKRIFVNVADANAILVFDRTTGETVGEWPLPQGASDNFPMALDEVGRVLFVGVRKPADKACVLCYDVDSGEVVERLPCVGDMDDLCFDASRQRLYVIGGAGRITVIGTVEYPASLGVIESKRYEVLSEVPTGLGARTGIWYPERDSLYVAAPATSTLPSRLLVYHAMD
ncbi:hypothetical protein CYMTET_25657 [Cymbomonas tetramitiformis]|uniref:Uncharacterized protein n=1 Tax=Cymbomonas tetramitiformis TaxID=36881 RepID=A0AAE0FU44_9CHLO|nr:hypothetical protein CYMTET_25657 [Cymbomonas tetramitiformis]